MVREILFDFPDWLIAGLVLGGIFTIVVTVAFVAGHRLFARIDERSPGPGTRGDSTGVDRRRAEIRNYLEAIGERYAEDRSVDGQRVAFYLPERDVAVTFDAHVFFGLQASDTEAVLIEHELPGGNLGSRLPFETPEMTIESDTEDGIAAAFAALGLPTTADLSDVKRAYRERVKEVHPDQGGDEEEFQRIREAYDTAKEYAD